MCVDSHSLSKNPCHCWDARCTPFIFPDCSAAAEAVARWPQHYSFAALAWWQSHVLCPMLPLSLHPFNTGCCGSLTTASSFSGGCVWAHTLASSSPRAAQRWRKICQQHGRGSVLFKLSTNTEFLCICLCFTQSPLAINIYLSNCTDSWIQFLFHMYNYYLPILPLIFCPLSFLYYLLLLISECSSLTSTPAVQFSSCRMSPSCTPLNTGHTSVHFRLPLLPHVLALFVRDQLWHKYRLKR